MVSTLILSVFVLAVNGFVGSLVRSGSLCDGMTGGVFLGQQKIEELKTVRLSELTSGSDIIERYTRRWTVTGGTASKTVEVIVSWNMGTGGGRQVVLRNAMSP
jgi:hypothetical protein